MGSRGHQISKPIHSLFKPNWLHGPLGEHIIKLIKWEPILPCVKPLGPFLKAIRGFFDKFNLSSSFSLSLVKMDERRHKVLIALVFFMAVRHVFSMVVILQQLALAHHYSAMTIMYAIMAEGDGVSRVARSVWMRDRTTFFLENQLFGSYTLHLFRQHTRLLPETFKYLCGILAPLLYRVDTNMRCAIPLKARVALSLCRLCSGNSLRGCTEIYGVHESTTSIIVREFCVAVEKHLKPLVIEKQTASTLRRIAAEFEELRGIPYVIGAVDGSHILIIVPPLDPISYYCRKGFYSALLQGVVDDKCRFWDYDFGWAGRCHDWTLFQNSHIGKKKL